MDVEDFAVAASCPECDNIEDYVETNPCTVLGNLRGLLRPDRKFVFTWADGEEVTEAEMAHLVEHWELTEKYEAQVAKAQEKMKRLARERQRANPQPASRPSLPV